MITILKFMSMPVGLIFALMVVGFFLICTRGGKKTKKIIVGRILIFLCCTCFYALSIFPVANALVKPLESMYSGAGADGVKNVQAVIVLGGGSMQARKLRPQAELSGASLARLVGGVKIFRDCGAKYLIVSGCSDVEGGLTTAEIMARVAFEMGVPAESIIIEKKATNTFEHPPRILEILPQAKNMRAAIVTSAVHMPRSVMAFEEYFDANKFVPAPVTWHYNVLPLSIRSFIPRAEALNVSTSACREYFGRIWYHIRSKPTVGK